MLKLIKKEFGGVSESRFTIKWSKYLRVGIIKEYLREYANIENEGNCVPRTDLMCSVL